MLLALGLILAVALVGWVAVDAARRQRNWLAWAMIVAFGGPIGMIVWLVARRSSPPLRPLGRTLATGLALAAVPLIFLNVAAVMFIVTYVFQVARVDGDVMAPALADRDRVIVNKWVYQTAAPRVGDIVMFRYPLNPDKTFVRRVIAEEGDQVQLVVGRVYRNTVLLDDRYVRDDFRSREDWGPEVIPPGYYFVMGDHRNKSSDSRHWGMVPRKYILGRVQLRWWPLPTTRVF
jgi:signal peptidase I